MSVPVSLAIISVTLATGVAITATSVKAVERHEVAGAADSAALAAADALFGFVPGDPCNVAAAVLAEHGKAMGYCEINASNVVIEAKAHLFNFSIKARAGFD